MAVPAGVTIPEVVTVQSARQYWAEILEVFRTENGREPRQDSESVEERKLAHAAWGYRLPSPAPVQAPEIRRRGVPTQARTQAWWDRLDTYAAWVRTQGRRPRPKNRGGEGLELRLHGWMARQRESARNGKLIESYRLALESLEQTIRRDKELKQKDEAANLEASQALYLKAWYANLHGLSVWHQNHPLMPTVNGRPAEKRLALWLNSERNAALQGLLSEDQVQALGRIRGALT